MTHYNWLLVFVSFLFWTDGQYTNTLPIFVVQGSLEQNILTYTIMVFLCLQRPHIISILQAYTLLERPVIIALSGFYDTTAEFKCGAYIVWSLLLV